MDFGRFEDFWRRVAHERLGVQGAVATDVLLERALSQWRSCVVCHLLQARAFDLVSRWQYVLSTDLADQTEFLAGQTWCNAHAWFFKEMMAPRDLARLHRQLQADLQSRVADMLRGGSIRAGGVGAAQILRALVGDRRCPLCDDRAALEGMVLEALARGLTSGALRAAFARSGGCCLPHVAALLRAITDRETATHVLEAVAAQSAALTRELDTYVVEAESRRRRYGSAADAPVRAMISWAGLRAMISTEPQADALSRAPGRPGGGQ